MKTFTPIVRGSSRLEVNNKGDVAELVLVGPVGGSWFSDDGIKESEVRDALKSIPKGTPINVRINSEGGSVQEGLGIYNAFKRRSKDITAFVVGYALSIASLFPLAASKVVSPKSAIWMIHKAWVFTQGNSDQLGEAIEMLKEHDEAMAEIYAEETGRPIQEMRDAMAAETWIRGSKAVDFGLADETDDEEADASASYRPLPADYLTRCKNTATVLNLFPLPLAQGDNTKQGTKPAGAPGGAQVTKMKDTVIALLKKHGVKVQDDWTDEQINKAAQDLNLDTKNGNDAMKEIHALKEKYETERKIRISARVDAFITDQRLTNEEREDAITRSMADEGYLNVIAKRPQHAPGGDPVPGAGVLDVSATDPILDLKKKYPVRAERYEVQKKDWDQILIAACRRAVRNKEVTNDKFAALAMAGINPFSIPAGVMVPNVDDPSKAPTPGPQAANTITSVLTNFLIDGSITDLQNLWAPVRAFSVDTRPDGYKPLAPGILKHVTAGSTAQTNPTNYESGNSTVTPVTVTPAEHYIGYQISNTDLNSGVRMADLVRVNTANWANLVIDAALAPLTVANFTQAGTGSLGGAATLISSAAAFGYNELSILQGALKKSPIKNLILDGSYIARVANQPGYFQAAGVLGGDASAWRIFGWSGIYNNTRWNGAAALVQGFACNPQAVGGIIGLPLLPAMIPGGILSAQVMTIDGLDIQVLAEAWFNPATRISWNSLRVMDGWAAVDTSGGAGVLITTG